ncbi:MAG: DNA topoisomerase 3 [Lachnospiraceae bacterium]|nr:DNA topoisomerase 3 [Lachnospiraceae bacterium]
MYQLVIAEKPSVARSIAEVLGATEQKEGYLIGNGYLVSWCIGHLIELVSADTYKEEWGKWSYETLPVIPKQWQFGIKGATRKQYQILEKLLKSSEVEEVICATDAGREGELIFRLVYDYAGCEKPMKRLWISSMEESAIREGFANLKDGSVYDRLYQSAVCRMEADWLVGINATRLFTVLYRHKLTVGRVQTPTLAMLVEREQKIAEFKKEQYFLSHILCDGMDAVTERMGEKQKAEQIAGACQNGQALVVSVVKEEKNIQPPKLYDLTTLQREANRYFGFTAQQTLDYTQSLYEKKLVTYPRTDSQYLTEDMGQTVGNIIGAVVSVLPEFSQITYDPNIDRVLNSKKVSDHHAIIPTMELTKTDLGKVPGGERQILSLIAGKLLCATGETHRYESVKAELSCEGQRFLASGKSIVVMGWKAFEEQLKKSCRAEKEKEEKAEVPLPELSEGMRLSVTETKVTEHYTTPPKHYTEDTLLSAMEHAGSEDMDEEVERKGLGTPATRAAIIEKLVEKGFVERRAKQMLPTDNGVKLITVLPEMVKSPKLTAEWENQLTQIAKGQQSAEVFMAEIEQMVTKLVETYHEVDESHKDMFGSDREIIGTCPKCGGNVYESKVNFYCENKECDFALFKNNKYFASMKKEVTKPIAQALLKSGKAKVSGLYSKKKDTTFTATISMDATQKYPQFQMEFEPKKSKKKSTYR